MKLLYDGSLKGGIFQAAIHSRDVCLFVLVLSYQTSSSQPSLEQEYDGQVGIGLSS